MNESVKVALVHPIDFESIRKGDAIGQAQIEIISQVRYSEDPERYRIEQMQLKGQIEQHRPDLAVVMSRRCLRVLTDPELVGYRQTRQERDVRSLKRNVALGARVDRSQLGETEVRRADCLDMHIAVSAIEADRNLRESRKKIRELDAPPETARLQGRTQ